MQSKMDLGRETSMVKVATALIEQALAIHRRALSQGPMPMPDMRKLAREVTRMCLILIKHGQPCKEATSQHLILIVHDTLQAMPLNFECELHVRQILPDIARYVGLPW